jgi:hypothetical protein
MGGVNPVKLAQIIAVVSFLFTKPGVFAPDIDTDLGGSAFENETASKAKRIRQVCIEIGK